MPNDLTPISTPDPATMTDLQKQKAVVRRLLELTDECGRGYYPLSMLAPLVGMTVPQLYDNNTNTGLLWEFGQHGRGPHQGALHFLPSNFTSVAINVDVERETEAWATWDGPEDDLKEVLQFGPDGEPVFTTENVAAVAAEVAKALGEDIEALKAQVADYENALKQILGADHPWAAEVAESVLAKWGTRR